MRAAVLIRQGAPLEQRELPDPEPGPGQIALTVRACGVCRTDLHLRDGEIEAPRLPVVLGHQIVGLSDDGRRLGVPWLGWTCGECRFCRSGRENLCLRARFTGRDIDGGYAAACRRRRALLLRAARRAERRAGGAAAVRWPDRLPRADPGR